MHDHFYQTSSCQIFERRIFIATSVRTRRVMGQFSMLLVDDFKTRLHETAKYFPFDTISFFMSVVLSGRLYKPQIKHWEYFRGFYFFFVNSYENLLGKYKFV